MNNEELLQQRYSAILASGDSAIDVGAHTGRHTLPLAALVGESGLVFAFEPIPMLNQQLKDAISFGGLSGRVHLFDCALSDHAGEAVFNLANEAPAYSGLMQRTYDTPTTVTPIRVQLETLDRLIPVTRKVRYIKIDCEGAELLVMRGGAGLISRDRPIISFESGDASIINYPYTAGDIFDFLRAFKYRIESLDGRAHGREEFVMANAEQHYWDYFAIPE